MFTQLHNTNNPQDCWNVIGVSLRSSSIRDLLRPQSFEYGVITRHGDERSGLRVTCLSDCLVALEDPLAVLDKLSSPAISIVTMTVTEKGYVFLPSSRKLDVNYPNVAHDLLVEHWETPLTAIGKAF